MTPRQRDCSAGRRGEPSYWNAQTLRDVQLRYPDMDLSPYRVGIRSGFPD